MKIKLTAAFIIFFSAVYGWAEDGKIIVIVNKEGPEARASKSLIKKIYSGKIQSWEDGNLIKACDQKLHKSAAQAFLSGYLDKSVEEYQALWMEKMLSGDASPPKSMEGDEEVIEFVSRNKGAIGYINEGALTDEVKKIE
ncbi:substrate-binding domain-containing protein [Fibrobacterota bacterium]